MDFSNYMYTKLNLAIAEPSSPIIEMLKPKPRGLDISWRTDVTSKQDKYVVIYTRNDTGQVDSLQTTDRGFSIDDLYQGTPIMICMDSIKYLTVQ